ncbi:hypothetical protein TRICHSKD4_4536 [Roseibium sp. TrichSKD4]|uniref:hypothetical protein n=1 Tax=Roseibium sp. TrichSKD4 TaxID=744980 RepID=UPI0001E57601|nr:hypothetical protein [Roseibium sp. TrichSKD4]EFO30936.1 hypothetical protein TRICHSKD4_4536 [Roseibium sp. TrichSKD4]
MEFLKPRSYSAIQIAIVAAIDAAGLFRKGAMVKAAPGHLSEQWLVNNTVPNQGCALVAIGRLVEVARHANGVPIHTLRLGVFLIPAPDKRNTQALHLSDAAFEMVDFITGQGGNRFGISGASVPKNLTAANNYSQSLDRKGSTLWTIEWTQSFHIFGSDNALRGGPQVGGIADAS